MSFPSVNPKEEWRQWKKWNSFQSTLLFLFDETSIFGEELFNEPSSFSLDVRFFYSCLLCFIVLQKFVCWLKIDRFFTSSSSNLIIFMPKKPRLDNEGKIDDRFSFRHAIEHFSLKDSSNFTDSTDHNFLYPNEINADVDGLLNFVVSSRLFNNSFSDLYSKRFFVSSWTKKRIHFFFFASSRSGGWKKLIRDEFKRREPYRRFKSKRLLINRFVKELTEVERKRKTNDFRRFLFFSFSGRFSVRFCCWTNQTDDRQCHVRKQRQSTVIGESFDDESNHFSTNRRLEKITSWTTIISEETKHNL